MQSLQPSATFSCKGPRLQNEDCIYLPNNNLKSIFLVCDGMGGHEKGEVASAIACQKIPQLLQQGAAIDYAFEQTLAALNEYAAANNATSMGTTVTLLYENNGAVHAAHIGDSRIYHIRGNSILYKSPDHSLVHQQLLLGIITEEEARHHPKKNVITKALIAGRDDCAPHVQEITNYQAGDYFFMCTDGVVESITDDELLHALNTQPATIAMHYIEEACSKLSHDNYSAILVKVK